MSNPFYYGNPVPPEHFLGRRPELRRVTSRIVNQGQSTAIIGEPRSGKTSLLLYLPQHLKNEQRTAFAYLDAQALDSGITQGQFRELALQPFYERIIVPHPDTALARAYQTCQENGFGAFVMERLLHQIGQDGWRLVLMLDEFDTLLEHQELNRAEFFGSLRSLTSRSHGALTLVIAGRQSPSVLNTATQEFNRTGSPYFNIFSEIALGPFPDRDVNQLLSLAKDRFDRMDRRFITTEAGGRPYLLQAAASTLWEAYEDGETDPALRRQQAGEALYDEAAQTIQDTWRLWTPVMRRAMASVALPQMGEVGSRFRQDRLLGDMAHFRPELRLLEKLGFIADVRTHLLKSPLI